jgi:hypothetical protein
VIRKRGARWQVRVYVGRDLLTGRKRYTTATVSTRAEAERLEARLVTEVDQGRHRAAGSKTAGKLVKRWFEWPSPWAFALVTEAWREHSPRSRQSTGLARTAALERNSAWIHRSISELDGISAGQQAI